MPVDTTSPTFLRVDKILDRLLFLPQSAIPAAVNLDSCAKWSSRVLSLNNISRSLHASPQPLEHFHQNPWRDNVAVYSSAQPRRGSTRNFPQIFPRMPRPEAYAVSTALKRRLQEINLTTMLRGVSE